MAPLPHPSRSRPAQTSRLGGAAYLMAIAAALVAASAARVPAGPVLVMAVLLAANALVLAVAVVRRPLGAGRPRVESSAWSALLPGGRPTARLRCAARAQRPPRAPSPLLTG